MDLPALIQKNIIQHGLLPAKTELVVGVSGGADSVALLRILQYLKIPCTVAHMNHHLRGAESDADEQFVRELTAELKLPMVEKSVHVQQLADKTGQSIEMAAREARHQFFAEFKNSVIALAHHADDQAETFILRLARGAGSEGLCGMPFFQALENLRLIRPMLNVPRAEIIQWLVKNRFDWREDTSNSDESFLRNRVRHTILPLFEKELNPNIRETILRTMDILRAENEWMEKTIADCRLPIADLPLAGQRRTLRKWLFEHGAEEAGLGAVNQILALISAGKGSKIFELNDRQRVVVEYGKPRFETINLQPRETDWTLTIEQGTGWKTDTSHIGELPAEASFCAEKIGDSPIEVRRYEPGDRMAPLGMEGRRKLQDIFTDLKIPREQRNGLPVVVCRGKIIWLPGYRISRHWNVPVPSAKAVHVRLDQKRTG